MHSYTKLSNLQEESHENVKTVQFHVIIEVKWLRPHARSLELDTVATRTGWRRTRGPKGFALAQPLVNYARDSNLVQNVSLENLLPFYFTTSTPFTAARAAVLFHCWVGSRSFLGT